MYWKIGSILVFMLLVFIVPAMAAGNLTVIGTNLAPTYVNTRIVQDTLNLTLNATVGNVNITAINVTIKINDSLGTGIGNVSLVLIKNSTGSTLVSSSTNLTNATFRLSIPGGFTVTTASNTSLIISINLS